MATVSAQKRSGAGAAKSSMSNPNGLLSQKLCHYHNQGCILNDVLMRAAHSMGFFDLSQLNLAQANMLKVFEYYLQFGRRAGVGHSWAAFGPRAAGWT